MERVNSVFIAPAFIVLISEIRGSRLRPIRHTEEVSLDLAQRKPSHPNREGIDGNGRALINSLATCFPDSTNECGLS